ncbi:FtsX-like permease family protein [Candidatus Woesearchaeota archaeon]|nr:FtsX-like permease family protein [Candidatus Woesearchaeota archaeon]
MFFDYFLIAWKNLIHKKLRSWLTVIGILIGVVAVVSLISLGEGLKVAINSQFGVSSTEVITVQAGGLSGYGPPGTGVVNPVTRDDAKEIENINSVERTITRNVESIKIEYNDKVSFGYATNLPDGDDRRFVYDQIEIEAEKGRLLKDGDRGEVLLGYNYIEEDNQFDKKILPDDTIRIQDEEFNVVGVAEKKGSLIFDNIVYFNEDDLDKLLDLGDEVDIIAVKVKNKELIDEAKEDIEKLLRKRRDVDEGEEDFEVSTPEAALSTVNQILLAVQIFIAMIASISIVVGSIGIINTMTTSVLERRREIGIMKSIGARNSDIFLQFFVESGLMGLLGGVIGAILGVTIGYFGTSAINNFVGSDASPQINLLLILLTLFGSFLIGAAAGILPALKAARQNPVDVLRG